MRDPAVPAARETNPILTRKGSENKVEVAQDMAVVRHLHQMLLHFWNF